MPLKFNEPILNRKLKESELAARTVRVHLDENWRQKIRISMLIDRLEKHALGEVEMTSTQIKAAEVLLRKSLPDLQSTELSGHVDGGGLAELLSAYHRVGSGEVQSSPPKLDS